MDRNINYFKYLKEVLGLNFIFQNLNSVDFSKHLQEANTNDFFSNQEYNSENHKTLFLNCISDKSQSLFEPLNNELFEKVRDAIHLTSENTYAVDIVLPINFRENGDFVVLLQKVLNKFSKCKQVIFMSSEMNADWGDLDEKKIPSFVEKNRIEIMMIPSVFLMRQNQNYKHMAWEHLKKLKNHY